MVGSEARDGGLQPGETATYLAATNTLGQFSQAIGGSVGRSPASSRPGRNRDDRLAGVPLIYEPCLDLDSARGLGRPGLSLD